MALRGTVSGRADQYATVRGATSSAEANSSIVSDIASRSAWASAPVQRRVVTDSLHLEIHRTACPRLAVNDDLTASDECAAALTIAPHRHFVGLRWQPAGSSPGAATGPIRCPIWVPSAAPARVAPRDDHRVFQRLCLPGALRAIHRLTLMVHPAPSYRGIPFVVTMSARPVISNDVPAGLPTTFHMHVPMAVHRLIICAYSSVTTRGRLI